MGPLKHFLLISLLLPAVSLVSAQPADLEIEPRPADPAPLAHKSLMLDIVQAGERYVAVGERGHVLYSDDGREWTQARFVPVSATLVRVTYTDGRLWAVGHDSTIIHSRDRGDTWSLQSFEPEWEQPLLDVHFFNANEGIAIGAYGLFMRTDDAGRHWDVHEMMDLVTSEAIDWREAAESEDEFADEIGPDEDDWGHGDDDWGHGDDDWDDEFYDPEQDFDRGCYEFMECHLNAVLDLGDGQMMMVAERGYGFRSTDGGESWESFRFPYPGSMFGLIPANGGVLAFGLRGNVQFSDNFGDSWEILDTGVSSSLMGATIDPEGRPVMVGGGAAVLTFNPQDETFRVREDRLGSDYAAVLYTTEGTRVLAGEDGLSHE
ncbi:hypothetical protein IC757_15300 [Wenzhouxiangella sp. AB-CW3]|uniref:WD40/YVTN/BNR-like repeat-containing protein n=1 Tax=Wenzhouxiangella sp. AB-CW3 TaxID=2771012 RepID=UPI00168AEF63|nr:hypothetical protein [Wenzhouxiangella sp. AB-CW3]QOC22361.1 hypothetical protein IC757_15300 [Wenzhouxiangella sp. AB-CW3]